MAVAVGFRARQRLLARVAPGDLNAPNSLAVDQRTHEYIGAFIEQPEMHPEIADVEVRGLRIVAKAAGLSHDGDVDSGLLQLANVLDGNIGCAPAVGLLLRGE